MHNILSLESAKEKGLVTSLFVEYLESRAYFLARGQYCIAPRTAERVSMAELFDTVAGSETGALIASNLLLPNEDDTTKAAQPNARWANSTSNWFRQEVNDFYYHYKFPMTAIFFCTVLLSFVSSGVAYRIVD